MTGTTGTAIAQNLEAVRLRIHAAAQRAGRDPDGVRLVAVTKGVEARRVAAAFDAGIRDFGENYAQEALAKQRDDTLNLPEIRWHFIGHLQRNKVKDVVGRFALIQSVDSLALAHEIGKAARQSARQANILLQVKLDSSPAKFGVTPGDTLDIAAKIERISGIALVGLMGIAPFAIDPEHSRTHFQTMRSLFDKLPPTSREILSMGMTGDFEVAVEEGASLIRIGTAIFGPRAPG